MDKIGDELFWCNGGAKLPTEPNINGTMDAPFFLVSLEGQNPNLNAIPVNRTDVNTTRIHCLYSRNVFEQCISGNRSRELTELEKLEALLKKQG